MLYLTDQHLLSPIIVLADLKIFVSFKLCETWKLFLQPLMYIPICLTTLKVSWNTLYLVRNIHSLRNIKLTMLRLSDHSEICLCIEWNYPLNCALVFFLV